MKIFDWDVYPHSKISRIHSPIIRWLALVIRNVRELPIRIKEFKSNFDPYLRLRRKEYATAAKLAIYYITSAEVSGDIVEFGTHGITAKIIARHLAYYRLKTKMHMFDSFQGYPLPTAKEDLNAPHIVSNVWHKGGAHAFLSAIQLKKLLQRFLPSEQFKIYEGWFENTLSNIPKGTKFAMLLMDCSFYKSHHEALTFLLKNRMISEGAIVLFTDWNTNKASPDCSSRKAWGDAVKEFNITYSNVGTYFWGGQKFIIHSYEK